MFVSSGNQRLFDNRVAWTVAYLKKAKLIESPVRGIYNITQTGKKLIKDKTIVINDGLLAEISEDFREFKYSYKTKKGTKGQGNIQEEDSIIDETPQEMFDRAFKEMNEKLYDEILSEIINKSSYSFEKLVVNLLVAMGYGDYEDNAAIVTSKTNDGGIDGIIAEDKLGFNKIYIQAKKFNLDSTVGRPEIQKFVGALPPQGGKGVFITTTKFSAEAISYAKERNIILIDGKKLVKLMVENNLGVSKVNSYEVKKVDSDYFNDI